MIHNVESPYNNIYFILYYTYTYKATMTSVIRYRSFYELPKTLHTLSSWASCGVSYAEHPNKIFGPHTFSVSNRPQLCLQHDIFVFHMEFHGTFILGVSIPWNLVSASSSMELSKFHGIPWNFPFDLEKFHGIPWNFSSRYGDSMEFHGIWLYSQIPWNF